MDESVQAVGGSELREATGTPGLHRQVAFEDENVWFGHVTTDAEVLSGWHHHGDMTTIGYVLDGQVRFEFGPEGEDVLEVQTGEYFRVPPRLVHREGNPTDQPGEILLVRVGEGPPVFPADGPEPGETLKTS